METYLITGGAGFIGSHFIKYLICKEPGARIVNVDKLTYAGNLGNLKPLKLNQDYIFVKEDITNKKEMDRIFSFYRPDYLINFAAESHVDRSIDDCGIFIETNVFGTQVLLQASIEHGIKKYVQISTDEVYGSLDGEGYFTEISPLKPRNPYAASKAGADMLTLAYHETYNLNVNISRCTNNYGPNQNTEKFIPKVIQGCLEGRKIPVYGDGSNIRDWIYVGDNCSAIYSILKRGIDGEIYNIGANNELENISIARLIIKMMNDFLKTHNGFDGTISEDLIEYVNDRKGHDKRYGIDSTKARKSLEWSPIKSFDEGMVETIRWYIENNLNPDGD